MSDYNKEALSIWNSLKPIIEKEIDSRTRGMVQRRKAKVTTAPSMVTNTIGVTEPYGPEMFLPFTSNIVSAVVGNLVWIEFAYGATNAVVVSFASADDKDMNVAGDLTVYGDATFNGAISGISVSDVAGAVAEAGADGFLFRSSNSVSAKGLMKTLWSAEPASGWSSGSITVDGLSNYRLFLVRMCSSTNTIYGPILIGALGSNSADGTPTTFTASTIIGTGTNVVNLTLQASVSGNDLTMGRAAYINVVNNDVTSGQKIIEIIGVI